MFIPALIIINVGIMSFEHYGQPQYLTQISDYSYYGFTLLLIGEMVLKLIAFGPVGYLKNRWNLLDIAIMIVSVVSILLGIMGMRLMIPFNPSTLRVCRVSKVAQVLRTKRLRVLINTISKTLSQYH
ncbi:voltage-dependent L-type calcium channel subunit alpha-1S-like [Odontesthes bonariensis]